MLAALSSNTRANLQTLVQGFGNALNAPATPAQDATQDPSVRGLTAAQALNQSLRYSAGAFKASAIVNQALLGTQPHDLSGAVEGNEEVFRALASRQGQLASLVTTFDATMRALAARQQDLSATIAALPPLLRTANRALTSLNASFGPDESIREGDPPRASPSSIRRSGRRCPGWPRPPRWSRRASWAAWWPT